MGGNPRNGRGRTVPFRGLIVAAIWFLAFGPVLIFALIGLIFADTTGAIVGAAIGIATGIASYIAATRALRHAEE